MWIDILIIAAVAAAAYFALRPLGGPPRPGVGRGCPTGGQCPRGLWSAADNRPHAE